MAGTYKSLYLKGLVGCNKRRDGKQFSSVAETSNSEILERICKKQHVNFVLSTIFLQYNSVFKMAFYLGVHYRLTVWYLSIPTSMVQNYFTAIFLPCIQ